MSNRLEDLEVYSLADTFSNDIWAVVMAWDYFAKDTIGKQFVRSSDSISANIEEGFGRYHFKENKKICYFSRGSILETKSWIKKAIKRELISDEQYLSLMASLELIHLKLNAYIKYIGRLSTTTPMTNDQ